MGMHGVVVLHPAIDESKCRGGMGDRADPDVVALEGLDESLGHAVALRAFDYPEFRESISRGKTAADAHVADALYRRARGYSAIATMPRRSSCRPGRASPFTLTTPNIIRPTPKQRSVG